MYLNSKHKFTNSNFINMLLRMEIHPPIKPLKTRLTQLIEHNCQHNILSNNFISILIWLLILSNKPIKVIICKSIYRLVMLLTITIVQYRLTHWIIRLAMPLIWLLISKHSTKQKPHLLLLSQHQIILQQHSTLNSHAR